MRLATHWLCLAALVGPATAALAQQPGDDVDPALSGLGSAMAATGGTRAPGSLFLGPIDVETPPFDNRCLGVEEAWDHYWVTGCGHTSTGISYRIHKFDLNGTYVGSYPQYVSPVNYGGWGGRDMEADEPGRRLWVGNDNGYLEEYSYDPVTGGLTHVRTIVTGIPQTIRALCRSRHTGNFYTGDMLNSIYEFDQNGTILAVYGNLLGWRVYGMAWDFCNRLTGNGTLWISAQDPGPTSSVHVFEVDPTTMTAIGPPREFWGITLPGSNVAGGLDFYMDFRDPHGPGALIALHQASPDAICVYDADPPPPTIAIANLRAGGQCTLYYHGFTPFGPIYTAWSVAGGGPTPSFWGWVYLTAPWVQAPMVVADASGRAVLTAPVPPAAFGKPLWIQSLDFLGLGAQQLSNGLAELVH